MLRFTTETGCRTNRGNTRPRAAIVTSYKQKSSNTGNHRFENLVQPDARLFETRFEAEKNVENVLFFKKEKLDYIYIIEEIAQVKKETKMKRL